MLNKTEWYQIPAADVIKELQTDKNGLTPVEAESRLKKLGNSSILKECLYGE